VLTASATAMAVTIAVGSGWEARSNAMAEPPRRRPDRLVGATCGLPAFTVADPLVRGLTCLELRRVAAPGMTVHAVG
jgi:hypothetical protein